MRWKVTVAYDGTAFCGWATQPAGNTVQDFLQKRLTTIFREPMLIQGASRTDSGVHARMQVFHFDADWKHPAEHLLRALRSGLPEGIMVRSVEQASDDFHARYHNLGKRYIYRIYEGWPDPFDVRYYYAMENRRLNTDLMQDAARRLIGTHNFRAFGADRRDDSVQNPVIELTRFDVTRDGPRVHITVEAGHFLYKMVRSLAGALISVGIGKLAPDEIEEILLSQQRTMRVVTAPARGLTLEEIFYPAEPSQAQ